MAHDPTPAGSFLKRVYCEPFMRDNNLTMEDMAKLFDINRTTLSRICNNHMRITVAMAYRIAAVFQNTTPDFWLKLQIQRRIWEESQDKKFQKRLMFIANNVKRLASKS